MHTDHGGSPGQIRVHPYNLCPSVAGSAPPPLRLRETHCPQCSRLSTRRARTAYHGYQQMLRMHTDHWGGTGQIRVHPCNPCPSVAGSARQGSARQGSARQGSAQQAVCRHLRTSTKAVPLSALPAQHAQGEECLPRISTDAADAHGSLGEAPGRSACIRVLRVHPWQAVCAQAVRARQCAAGSVPPPHLYESRAPQRSRLRTRTPPSGTPPAPGG